MLADDLRLQGVFDQSGYRGVGIGVAETDALARLDMHDDDRRFRSVRRKGKGLRRDAVDLEVRTTHGFRDGRIEASISLAEPRMTLVRSGSAGSEDRNSLACCNVMCGGRGGTLGSVRASRGPEPVRQTIFHRWSHHAPSRLRNQPAHPQAG
ncbi:hypothetical protein GDI2685 [Gluconacetobacter diazotrophicus PA1 5]|uniref:Uncharacterized protein n=1 Tax=Gluconacetobacter diazotrophicus (strain ATCC 49037 / DSM 5601 / CCUG 37298 / CIP 103539 / LMG 7603 / PAl5) TaxID=272568 RepID=A9HPS9_GLUDA|nr:hypothetical protein GDI2685 [Gluconacetobacter diazotrophicus PA1 5]